jgi:hypothetical protein
MISVDYSILGLTAIILFAIKFLIEFYFNVIFEIKLGTLDFETFFKFRLYASSVLYDLCDFVTSIGLVYYMTNLIGH